MNPGPEFTLVSTQSLPKDIEGDLTTYKEGENRSSIWTKYPVSYTYPTYDPYTSVCADILTPFGILAIYATIIGVFGGKGKRFQEDLKGQLSDFDKLFPGKHVCLIGDFNTTFNGFKYPNEAAQRTLNEVFQKFNLNNLTTEIEDCVDHIAISKDFIIDTEKSISLWNLDKRMSDHVGVSVSIS